MSSRTYLIPREIAEQLGVNVGKVLGWIRSGELAASNISDSGTRPRWRIDPQAFEAFLKVRSNKAVESRKPDRRRLSAIREYV